MPKCGFYITRRQKIEIFLFNVKKILTKEIKIWPQKKLNLKQQNNARPHKKNIITALCNGRNLGNMATKKIKFCDNSDCKKELNGRYLHFPFYGFHGRDFCNEYCLNKWAFHVSDFKGKYLDVPEIKID